MFNFNKINFNKLKSDFILIHSKSIITKNELNKLNRIIDRLIIQTLENRNCYE